MAHDARPQTFELAPVKTGIWLACVARVDIECLNDRLVDHDLPKCLVQTLLKLLDTLLAGHAGQKMQPPEILFSPDPIDLPVIEPEPLDRHPHELVVREAKDLDHPGEVKSEVDGL